MNYELSNNDLSHFYKIIKCLEKNKIKHSLSYDKRVIFVFEYPEDLRILYTDIKLTEDYKIIHTNEFYYRVSWTIWNKRKIQIKTVTNQDEVIKLIEEVIKDFGIKKIVQQTLNLF